MKPKLGALHICLYSYVYLEKKKKKRFSNPNFAKILEREAHNERLCFIYYNWDSAKSLVIDANHS